MVNVEELPPQPFIDLMGRMGLTTRIIDSASAGQAPIEVLEAAELLGAKAA